MSERADVIVLGAGMAGLGAALALQDHDRDVVVLDRRPAGEETSFGNAGLIQAEAVRPYAFPRHLGTIMRVALGRSTEARVAWSDLARTAPWIFQYWRNGAPTRVAATMTAMAPLVRRATADHEELIQAAEAEHLVIRRGYLRVWRDPRRLDAALREQEAEHRAFGVSYTALDAAGMETLVPHLSNTLAGGIHMTEPIGVTDPGDLCAAYARLFEARGGRMRIGDAHGLTRAGERWRVDGVDGAIEAPHAVIALGPWSGDLLRTFGQRVPLGVKRGYHRHFAPAGNAGLDMHIVDEEHGYVLAPNRRGVRVTSGAEFARRDAPPSPRQLTAVEPIARKLFPLGDAIDPAPWIGSRPCLPDLVPMIGPVPGADGLWAHFGHHHLGLTLGPITGRLLAEMMTGATPFTDPTPYRVDRF